MGNLVHGATVASGGLAMALLLGSVVSAGPELVSLPEGYRDQLTHYATVNRPDERKQVVKIYANDVALASAKDGVPLDSGAVLVMEIYKTELGSDEQPVEGADGLFVPAELAAITVMEQRAGWGAEYPEEVRNENWEYAAFNPDGSRREIQVENCLACHKPIADQGFVFSFEALKGAAGS